MEAEQLTLINTKLCRRLKTLSNIDTLINELKWKLKPWKTSHEKLVCRLNMISW